MDDLERMKEGDSSEFNSSLATLMRMHQEFVEANYYSGLNNLQGIQAWLGALRALDREISPYLGPEEKEQLNSVRVKQMLGDPRLVPHYFERLDNYERLLREFHAKKGFGLKASDRDPRKALQRDMT